MAERPLDPFEAAVAFAIREAARRKATEVAERRSTMTIVEGGKRKGGAAA